MSDPRFGGSGGSGGDASTSNPDNSQVPEDSTGVAGEGSIGEPVKGKTITNESGNEFSKVGDPETLEETAESAEPEGSVVYSSHPIQRLNIGGRQFEKGVLTLTPAEADDFEAFLEKASQRTRNMVKKIDPEGAARVAAAYAESKRIRGTDTSEDRPGSGR